MSPYVVDFLQQLPKKVILRQEIMAMFLHIFNNNKI